MPTNKVTFFFHSPLPTIKMKKKCPLVSSKTIHPEAQNSRSDQVATVSPQSTIQKQQQYFKKQSLESKMKSGT
jgi:hypothetical protein